MSSKKPIVSVHPQPQTPAADRSTRPAKCTTRAVPSLHLMLMKLKNLAWLIAIGISCAPAFGQWQWLDASGRKVYSDRPPPAEVPEKNILRRPGQVRPTSEAAEPPAPASAGTKPAGGAAAAAEDPLEKKKKEAEAAEAAKKKAEEEKQRQLKADNCKRAKAAKAALTSGMRMARINDKGEREILDDAARAAELKRIDEAILANCE